MKVGEKNGAWEKARRSPEVCIFLTRKAISRLISYGTVPMTRKVLMMSIVIADEAFLHV